MNVENFVGKGIKMKIHDATALAYVDHLYAKDRRTFSFIDKADGDFESWSEAGRAALRELIGLNRIHDDCGRFSCSVSLGATESLDGYTRQKNVLHAEPGVDIPFWYLRPIGSGPHPVALFPHGHYANYGLDYAVGISASVEMERKIIAGERDVAIQAVEHGFAAIAPATRGFLPSCIPDLTERHGGSNCRSHLIHALLAGRTVIGERVWDLGRLIDWAISQPDILASTILMMGNSGGGVATLYTAACDERINIAVASCSFCTFVGQNGAVHHCDCNAVPGIMRFGEFYDVAGLIAPRHLLIVHGRTDPLFPLEEIQLAVSNLERIYDASAATHSCRHVWGPEGHRFYRDLMWPFVTDAAAQVK